MPKRTRLPRGAARPQQKERFPEEPWRWREDWEQGVIPASREGGPVTAWFAAFVMLAVGSVFAALMWNCTRSGLGPTEPIFWFLPSFFALIGLLQVWRGVVLTVRALRFGRPVLRLDQTPCVLGGQLRGTIDFGGRRLPGAELATLELCERCWLPGPRVRSRTGAGALWRLRVPVVWRPHDSAVPILLPIPSDGRVPDASGSTKFSWRLRLCASVPGPDLDVQFDLPVFAGEGGDPAQTKEAIEAAMDGSSPAAGEDALIENLRREGVRLKRYPAGLELRVSPIGMRRRGFAVAALIAMAIPAVFWYVALRTHPSVGRWLGFASLAGLGAVVGSLTLGKSVRVRAGGKGLRITRHILGVPTVWQVPYENIESIETDSRYGSSLVVETQDYYDLDIKWQDGGRSRGVRIALGTADMATADALAQALRSACGRAAPREKRVSGRTEVPSSRVSTARQERFPEEPWRWRADWEQGTVLASTEDGPLAAWVAAVLIPIFLGAAWRSENGRWLWERGAIPWLPITILALVVTGLLVRAIIATRRSARYGRTLLRLATTPCPQGGQVRGTIEFAASRPPASPRGELGLEERHASDDGIAIVWRLRVPIALRGTEGSVPFCLPIPSDGKEATPREVDWRVRLRASTSLDVAFEIPVFAVEGGNPAQTKAAIEAAAALSAVKAGKEDLNTALAEASRHTNQPKL